MHIEIACTRICQLHYDVKHNFTSRNSFYNNAAAAAAAAAADDDVLPVVGPSTMIYTRCLTVEFRSLFSSKHLSDSLYFSLSLSTSPVHLDGCPRVTADRPAGRLGPSPRGGMCADMNVIGPTGQCIYS